ncbi:YraN family protein [Paenibacillus sp. CF384]|uniref:YraN family protein n=1 Tax=Paenibacillus sp. CF384 TaxID=1884382 RepID=UPI00089A0871|nr:YraN family protein [Paenibacillus sp. CF384]SDW28103.1 putative endonuclease [Paenibacillus sp. CF384]
MKADNRTSRTDTRQAIGKFGEEEAVRYLKEQGYTIIHRNWRCRMGELDIVAKTDSILIVVEVRTRRAGGRFGTAAESVDIRKQLKVRSITEVYLSMNKLQHTAVRFDVVAITAVAVQGESLEPFLVTELKHIESAF